MDSTVNHLNKIPLSSDSTCPPISQTQKNRRLIFHVWIVCALGLFIDGYDLYIASVAEPFINAFYHPTPFLIGLTQAAAPIGACVGAILIGRIADLIGRKSLLILNLVFFVVIALLSALAWNPISLCFFRFLVGFGVGADYPICAAYLAEMIPRHQSRKFISSAMFINCTASPVGALIAWGLFTLYPHVHVWRLMFASGALPALIALFLRAQLPESFLWQAQKRLNQSSDNFLKNYKRLFSPSLKKMTLCMGFSWFLLDISYYGIGLFTPAIFQAFHLESHIDFMSSLSVVLKNTFIVNLFVLLGAFGVIFFIEKINLIQLQRMGFLVSFMGLLLLGLSDFGSANTRISMIFSGFIIFNFFINFGPGITTYLLPTEVYETSLKATGHGLVAGLGKLGAFVGTIFLPLLHAYAGIYLTLGLLSATLLIGATLTHFLRKEEIKQNLKMGWHLNNLPISVS